MKFYVQSDLLNVEVPPDALMFLQEPRNAATSQTLQKKSPWSLSITIGNVPLRFHVFLHTSFSLVIWTMGRKQTEQLLL